MVLWIEEMRGRLQEVGDFGLLDTVFNYNYMTTLRFKRMEEAIKRKALEIKSPEVPASGYFGRNVFYRKKMAEYDVGRFASHISEI